MTVKEKKPWRQTPLIESSVLSKAAGCRILLKLDHLQPSGSFKSRGIGNLLLCAFKRSTAPERVHFFCSSGGNAGLAAVHAAKFLGRPCTVVVPTSTKPMMVAKIKAAGASEVVQVGVSIQEADAHMREVVIREAAMGGEECVYVPPFDHPDIWEGHTTVVEELRAQLGEMGEGPPDVIACSVGGGGLFNGIVQGLERLGGAWDATDVLCVETEGCDALARSLEAGENVTLDAITSQATSLGARRVSDRTFELATRLRATGRVKNVVLSDAEAAMGCWRLADDERIMVELACGVNLALCYGGRLKRALGRPVHPDEKVVIEVCGGQGVTTSMLEQWKREFAYLDGNEMNGHEEAVPSMFTGPN